MSQAAPDPLQKYRLSSKGGPQSDINVLASQLKDMNSLNMPSTATAPSGKRLSASGSAMDALKERLAAAEAVQASTSGKKKEPDDDFLHKFRLSSKANLVSPPDLQASTDIGVLASQFKRMNTLESSNTSSPKPAQSATTASPSLTASGPASYNSEKEKEPTSKAVPAEDAAKKQDTRAATCVNPEEDEEVKRIDAEIQRLQELRRQRIEQLLKK